MIPCEKATRLISKQLDEPLSIMEKIQLYSHTIMCWCCQRFQKQVIEIKKALREIAHEVMAFERFKEIGMPDLSPQAKQRVMRAIQKNL